MTSLKNLSDKDLKLKLSEEQFRVLRLGETEPAFSGNFVHNEKEGSYVCGACGQILFSSKTKFDSGSGWPSFFDVADSNMVELKNDHSYGMHRVEVTCSKCKSHLGHLFSDGPKPTGKRYCINSLSLDFKEKK
jgi:peptide-methionine (R)-S-oxide reductase